MEGKDGDSVALRNVGILSQQNTTQRDNPEDHDSFRLIGVLIEVCSGYLQKHYHSRQIF